MQRLLIGCGLITLLATSAAAQTLVTPDSRVGWDQAAPDLATVQGYTYQATVDTLPAVPLTAVTCSGTASPFVCGAAWPPATPTDHTITVTASVTVNGTTVTSLPSTPFAFRFAVVPSTPANVRMLAR